MFDLPTKLHKNEQNLDFCRFMWAQLITFYMRLVFLLTHLMHSDESESEKKTNRIDGPLKTFFRLLIVDIWIEVS